ncbi:MAG: TAXI family TRAP transporter solute-binding subunit [Rhodocyclaceae bacterium]|nr:TAXI family TRAP transporter solute-binding subunit [Rhodocyclaceae bacterium]
MTKKRITKRLSELSTRDLLAVGLPLVLLLIAGFWLAARFIQPAPPSTLVFSSGGDGGAYQRFAVAYRDVLARHGITLIEKPSAGAIDNLKRLRTASATEETETSVSAGFFQEGAGEIKESDTLQSLGGLYYEPLWIFLREDIAESDRLLQLKGKRIAVGSPGSGTRHLALELLEANGVSAKNTRFFDKGGIGLVEAFRKNEIDAALVVGPPQSATVWSLLFTPGIRLMSLTHAEAYTRQFPYLSKVILPRGAVDVARDLPDQDIPMVATTATVLVREDLHPALVDIMLEAAIETHGMAGLFQKQGEFPRATTLSFPLSDEAKRYYKSGKPFLQRYLPFWTATLLDRMTVMLIPLIALLIPLIKIAPGLYRWRVSSHIYRRYGELKFIEAEVDVDPARYSPAEWMAKLDAIEADANRITVPLAFADMLYTLKSHIAFVRETVQRRITATIVTTA